MPRPPLSSSRDLTKFQDRRLFWHPSLWYGLGSEEGPGWCEGRGPESGAPGGEHPAQVGRVGGQPAGLGDRGPSEGQP